MLIGAKKTRMFWSFAAGIIAYATVVHGLVKLMEDRCDLSKRGGESDCPRGSTCMYRGCGPPICVCDDGQMPLNDNTCVKIAELGEPCDNVTRSCRGRFTKCRNNKCVCPRENVIYGKFCIDPNEAIPTPKRYYSDVCNESLRCPDRFHMECIQSRCQCSKGYKFADTTIMNAYPFNAILCVKDDFALGKSYENETNCPVEITGTTSYPTLSPTTFLTTKPSIVPTTTEAKSTSKISSSAVQISSTISPTAVSKTATSSITPETISSYSKVSVTSFSASSSTVTNSRIFSKVMETIISTETTVTTSPDSLLQTSQSDLTSSASSSTLLSISSTPVGKTSSSVSVGTSKTSVSLSSKILSTSPVQSTSFSSVPSTGMSSSNTAISTPTTTSLSVETSTISSSNTPELPLTTSSSTAAFASQETKLASSIIPSPSITAVIFSHYSGTLSLNISPSSMFHSSAIHSTSPELTSTFTAETSTLSLDQSHLSTSSEIQSAASSISSESLATSSILSPMSSTMSTTMSTTVSTPSPPTEPRRTTETPVNHVCDSLRSCPENAECAMTTCNKYRCRCKAGYAPDANFVKCVEVVKLGQPCSPDKVCMGPKVHCKSGTCRCVSGYTSDATYTRCKRKPSWFIEFPVATESCSSFFKECHNAFEQECKNERCTCKEGLREMTELEMKIHYDSYSQCVNASLENGFRKNASCEAALSEEEPSIADAKKRIQIMQGLIIGAGLLVLLVIAGMIALLLCIRHKRRVGDMRSETSSIVSLDRRSEGKYSFRIPRPFATPILYAGTNGEADAMSYQNSAYDGVGERDRLRDEEHKSVTGTMARGFHLSSDDIEFKFYDDEKGERDEK